MLDNFENHSVAAPDKDRQIRVSPSLCNLRFSPFATTCRLTGPNLMTEQRCRQPGIDSRRAKTHPLVFRKAHDLRAANMQR
jgi:hypothetical protein